jgi:hypothetical protein
MKLLAMEDLLELKVSNDDAKKLLQAISTNDLEL